MTSITQEQTSETPDVEQPNSVRDAQEFARDYEQMAAFLAAHPDLAERASHDGVHRFLISVSVTKDPLAEIASAARAGRESGIEVTEYVSSDFGGVQLHFGRVCLQVYAVAAKTVREVVVGHVPDVRRSLAIDLDGNPRQVAEQDGRVAR